MKGDKNSQLIPPFFRKFFVKPLKVEVNFTILCETVGGESCPF